MMQTFHAINLKRIRYIVLSLAIPLAIGALSGFFIRGSVDYYKMLTLPPLAPPGWVFPVVWTVLYLMMGAAAYLAWSSMHEYHITGDALKMYAITLVLNFLWPIVFFNMRSYLFAFLILLVLWIFVGITAAKFYRLSRPAGYLMLPYWIWLIYAGYLNLAIWILN